MSVTIPTECPVCGRPDLWDNRPKKSTGQYKATAPDFACKDRGCRGAVWLTPKGASSALPTTPRPAAAAQEHGGWFDARRLYQTCLNEATKFLAGLGDRAPSTHELHLTAQGLLQIALAQKLPATADMPFTRPPSAPPVPVNRGAEHEVEDDVPDGLPF